MHCGGRDRARKHCGHGEGRAKHGMAWHGMAITVRHGKHGKEATVKSNRWMVERYVVCMYVCLHQVFRGLLVPEREVGKVGKWDLISSELHVRVAMVIHMFETFSIKRGTHCTPSASERARRCKRRRRRVSRERKSCVPAWAPVYLLPLALGSELRAGEQYPLSPRAIMLVLKLALAYVILTAFTTAPLVLGSLLVASTGLAILNRPPLPPFFPRYG